MIISSLDVDIAELEARTGWSFKPEGACKAEYCVPIAGRALASAEAPELILPDRHGNEFRLSSLRGLKVLLLAWASW